MPLVNRYCGFKQRAYGGRNIAKICPKCGKENSDDARFCSNCGAQLKDSKNVKSAKKVSGAEKNPRKIDSFYILGAVFLISLVIVLLILNANRRTEEAKIKASAQRGSSQQMSASSGQPPMEMMQKIQQLKEEFKASPNNYGVLVQLGNSYFDIGRFEKAVKFYRRAVAVQNTSPEVLIDLGVAYFNAHKADSALFYVKEALQIQHDHPQGLYNLGIIYYNLNQTDKAIETWQRLVDHHPDSREAQAARDFIKQVKNR